MQPSQNGGPKAVAKGAGMRKENNAGADAKDSNMEKARQDVRKENLMTKL